MNIVLVRHGRSGHYQSGLLDVAAFRRWREAYEAAGIDPRERPPADLVDAARVAGVVAASDAARAIASAKLLAPEHEVVIAPLLRELELPPPNLGRLRLPLPVWMLAIGVIAVRARPEEIARAHEAARWLIDLASKHETVVAVTHGSIRRLIGFELQKRGWLPGKGRRGFHHWSVWSFSLNG